MIRDSRAQTPAIVEQTDTGPKACPFFGSVIYIDLYRDRIIAHGPAMDQRMALLPSIAWASERSASDHES